MIPTLLVKITETLMIGRDAELLIQAGGQAFAIGLGGIEVSSRTAVSISF